MTNEDLVAAIRAAVRRGPVFPGEPVLRHELATGEGLTVFGSDTDGMVPVEVIEAPSAGPRGAYAAVLLSLELLSDAPDTALEVLLRSARDAFAHARGGTFTSGAE